MADLILNQKVTLTYGDVERDGYGRLIASVRTEDHDVATYLLENGLAHAFLFHLKVDTPKLLAAQQKAQTKGIGLWSISRYKSDLHMTSFHANAPGDDSRNVNGEYIRVTNTTSSTHSISKIITSKILKATWNFPDMEIPTGNTVKVHSGRRYHQRNPEKQLKYTLDQCDRFGTTRRIGRPFTIWKIKSKTNANMNQKRSPRTDTSLGLANNQINQPKLVFKSIPQNLSLL